MNRINQFALAALAAAGLFTGATRAHAQDASINSNSPDILMGFEVADDSTNPGGNTNIELDLGYTAATLVAAANSNGGSLVLGGTNSQQDLSADDLGATYGATWYTRTSGGGEVKWSIFGANTDTNEFWVTNVATFLRTTNSTQTGIAGEMGGVYSDLSGETSTANSNQDYINTNASGDSGSYFNAITGQDQGSNWNYSFGASETVVGDTSAIGFWDSPDRTTTGQDATELGTFSLSDTGVLTFDTLSAIPEPSTWAMMGFGAATLLVIRRRLLHA